MEINKLNKFINTSKSWNDLVNCLGEKSLNDKFKGDVFELSLNGMHDKHHVLIPQK